MQAINTTFRQLIDGTKQFIIPVFQRDYAWDTPNWQQLWNDISRTAVGNGDRGHFVGSVVHIPDSTVATRPSQLVIDGQQRLTTLTILCAALRDYIKKENLEAREGLPTPEQVDAYFISNTLVLQRRVKEGCWWMSGQRRGVSHGTVWLARCVAGHHLAIAATPPARTAPAAKAHAPLGTPGAG